MGRKPDILLIHSRTNDLTNHVSTIKKVTDLVKCICDLDRNEEIQIGFPSISRQLFLISYSIELEKEINETNTKLRKYFEDKESFSLTTTT